MSLLCGNCAWSLRNKGSSDTTAPQEFVNLLPSPEEGRDLFNELLDTVTPRPVIGTWGVRARIGILSVAGALAAWTFFEYANHRASQQEILILVFAIWIVAAASFPLMSELPKRKLVREGDVSVGRVIYQKTFSGNRTVWSVVAYAFADRVNRGFVGQGTDYSDSLGEGAPVLVYYDRNSPQKNVAAECSKFRVKPTRSA